MNDELAATTRLNKFIAMHLAIGRRQADTLIEQGKVLVNGHSPQLGARVTATDTVSVAGKVITTQPTQFLYVLLNKPIGYVCSRRQQGETPTIYALLPQKYQHLKPVGRLDKDSSGLLLLTNDGDLAHRFTHPSFGKLKKYEVMLDKPLQPLHHQLINDHGITLPDGNSQLQLERLRDGNAREWRVTMHEGRNRQIRRTFAALGYAVTRLHRTQFGPFSIHRLQNKPYCEVAKPQ